MVESPYDFLAVPLGAISMGDLERLEAILNWVFANTVVLPDGSVTEQRELVERIDGLRIEIYPNDHKPTHFHVVSQTFEIKFDIMNCEVLKVL